jgi:hypothetical protein
LTETAAKEGVDLEIVILCNRLDVYLTRICVASIRAFYPDITIHIVKDNLNGAFSTVDIERAFNVRVLDLGLSNYGWCTGKIALILATGLAGRKILLLDSDIVFIGRVLEPLQAVAAESDFVVSPEAGAQPGTDWFRRTYFDPTWAVTAFPDYEFPGFTFNCGQILVTPGVVQSEELFQFVDLSRFPYWTREAERHLPCRDQSLLNIILPLKARRAELRLSAIPFMLWCEEPFVRDSLSMEQIAGAEHPRLIHWAGATRHPDLGRMTRSDILYYFQKQFYSRLPAGRLRRWFFNSWHSTRALLVDFARSVTTGQRR